MGRAYPADVIVLDTDGLLHARLSRGKTAHNLTHAKLYRLPAGTFQEAVVTPELVGDAAVAETLRRLRMETGRWERLSLLLPDSWFRMNLLDLPSLPDQPEEALHTIRWSLKRTLPIPPDSLRVSYEVLSRTAGSVRVLALSAVEKTLSSIERVFTEAGLEVVLIESIGLNIWNAVTVREAATSKDRLFMYVRDRDFTTAVFRGGQPLFIRSRNLSGERTLQQEIRLSASYLRDTLQAVLIERCYVAGNSLNGEVTDALSAEFGAPVSKVSLRDYAGEVPPHASGMEAELTACMGVFT